MPERTLVTNTSPLIALAIATGSLEILRCLYDRGEAAVIMIALQEKIPLVCIDAAAGRGCKYGACLPAPSRFYRAAVGRAFSLASAIA